MLSVCLLSDLFMSSSAGVVCMLQAPFSKYGTEAAGLVRRYSKHSVNTSTHADFALHLLVNADKKNKILYRALFAAFARFWVSVATHLLMLAAYCRVMVHLKWCRSSVDLSAPAYLIQMLT